MKAVVLYHPNSEFSRLVEEYVHDFKRIKGQSVELVSLETREGTNMARLYDIVVYPALCVFRDNGELIKQWQGSKLPLMDEVAAYLEVSHFRT